jgi:hypothetical protein
MLRRVMLAVALLTVSMAGCALVHPAIDCRLDHDCAAVLGATRTVVSLDAAHVVVIWGRGRDFHAESHVCYANGRYVLVDVMGDAFRPSIREEGWSEPACR